MTPHPEYRSTAGGGLGPQGLTLGGHGHPESQWQTQTLTPGFLNPLTPLPPPTACPGRLPPVCPPQRPAFYGSGPAGLLGVWAGKAL